MIFLTAHWKNLIMANYIVNPEYLEKYLPAGTELDFWNGNCYVSLVGFLFKDTKVLGLRIPNHTDFEEVNLRFYVKRFEDGIWKRGVVFIKEIVPKSAITFVANTFYKENYETRQMNHSNKLTSEVLSVAYQWKNQDNLNSIKLTPMISSPLSMRKAKRNSSWNIISAMPNSAKTPLMNTKYSIQNGNSTSLKTTTFRLISTMYMATIFLF